MSANEATEAKVRHVWRIEHAQDGYGPFIRDGVWDPRVQAMPLVRGYGLVSNTDRREATDYVAGWRFAFTTLAALRRWFPQDVLQWLHNQGYVLRRYEVPQDHVNVAPEAAPAYKDDAYPRPVNAVFNPKAARVTQTRRLTRTLPKVPDPVPEARLPERVTFRRAMREALLGMPRNLKVSLDFGGTWEDAK